MIKKRVLVEETDKITLGLEIPVGVDRETIGGALSIKIVIVGNGISDQSLNPGQDYWYFPLIVEKVWYSTSRQVLGLSSGTNNNCLDSVYSPAVVEVRNSLLSLLSLELY